MNRTELADQNVQDMRDQGIADACNGYPAFAFMHGDDLLVADPCGVHIPLADDASHGWREAFAYARAYDSALNR